MIKNLYSVYDKKTDSYSPPMESNNDEEMMRTIASDMGNENSLLHKFPTDFELHIVGSWDNTRGKVVLRDKKLICTLIELHPSNQMTQTDIEEAIK